MGGMAERVVLIMTDTQRWDMLGCYGNLGMCTPNLDGLAAQGIRYERAYTCQPVCAPARAAIFTGLYPHSAGVMANCMPLGDNIKTIGQRLRDNGILAAYIGKWHLDGGDYFGLGRCPDGWDPKYWYDMRLYLEELTPDERLKSRRPPSAWKEPVREEFTFGHRCAERAVSFLSKHAGDRFFLAVSFDEPHGPHLCPQKYVEMYRDYEFPKRGNVLDDLKSKPEHIKVWARHATGGVDRETVRIKHPDLFGCNTFADFEIGRILDAVEHYAPDALVIYTSDHGDALYSHGISGKGPAVYDEVARVPLIVKWPGKQKGGSVCRHPASHINLAPTIMDAFGLPVPKIFEGKSILQSFLDPESRPDDTVFMEFTRYEVDHDDFGGFQPVRAVFDGRYKLAINLLAGDELYDLESDPEEMKNLIGSPEHAAVRNALHDKLLDWMNRTRDPFRGYYWERRPWRTDAREASWRYTGMTRQRENEEYEPRQLDYNTGLEMTEAVRLKK